ncbi:hypothetical protein LSTR_LSTR000043 [Laodelphax striatellus]|uniref:BESS domain-containing protein n=1 Tax=Laodelphax striatellus TaxID=195883 RepID=A0A482X616_LAOST|nr:hypothetical protein LSTR_LSTR000043 [Laodelphax striatellus]
MSEDEIRLIEVVKRYNVLYDLTATDYKDHTVRDAAWEQVRWSKLRNCYTNALKRRRFKRGRTGRQMPPWKYENQMSYLLPYMQGKAISGDMFDADEPFVVYEDDVEVDLHTATPAVELGSAPSTPNYVIMRSPTPEDSVHSNHINGSSVTDDRLVSAYRRMNHTKQAKNGDYSQPDLDETDHFFLSMSKSLKRLSAINQARIKMDLHRAIYEAEIHLLETLEKQASAPNSDKSFIKKE